MTAGVGSGTGTPSTPAAIAAPCREYLTVAEVRSEFGDDVAEMSDAQIQRRIDDLAALLEDNLGHSFGRALMVFGGASDTVTVAEDMVALSGDGFAFADFPTLGELAAAINAAGADYSADLLPTVSPATPSSLLAQRAETAVGPDYDDRAVLCLSALYVSCHGDGTSHVFLPLPVGRVVQVLENGSVTTAYWSRAGEPWLIKKACGCSGDSSCSHARGRWSGAYPANVLVTYVPASWSGRLPAALRRALLEAFEGQAAVGGALQSESFGGEYSYSQRAGLRQGTWQDALSGAAVRQYAVRITTAP